MDTSFWQGVLGGAAVLIGNSLLELVKSYNARKNVKFAAYYAEQAKVLVQLYKHLTKANRQMDLAYRKWNGVRFLEKTELGGFAEAANIMHLQQKYIRKTEAHFKEADKELLEVKVYYEDNAIYFDEKFSDMVYTVLETSGGVFKANTKFIVSVGDVIVRARELDLEFVSATVLLEETLKNIRKRMRTILSS